VAAFGAALGLDNGAANFDLRQVGDRTFLIEVNPRLGGNSITDLIRHAYGVELARAAVLCALGRDPGAALARHTSHAVAARLILRRGRGVARFGPFARRHPGLLALDLSVSDGEHSQLHVDDFCLLGRCIVRGASPGEAVQLAENIAHEVATAIHLEAEGDA
jgi:biotin carboxylase